MFERVVDLILSAYPSAQAIYLFGSAAADAMRADSDVDVAVLLPHTQARAAGDLTLSNLAFDLMRELKRDVHLINLRRASTVLQLQVVGAGKVLHNANNAAREEFEMLTLSFYQKLNEERASILRELQDTKRVYPV